MEDVLVTVGKLVFPIDFVIMDKDEHIETPLILGRPCLNLQGLSSIGEMERWP